MIRHSFRHNQKWLNDTAKRGSYCSVLGLSVGLTLKIFLLTPLIKKILSVK